MTVWINPSHRIFLSVQPTDVDIQIALSMMTLTEIMLALSPELSEHAS
jgi:hypothetical protein